MESKFETYIYGLNINELRKLVLEIATDDIKEQIEQQVSKQHKASAKVDRAFKKLRNAFLVIFEDEANLYIINNFERHVYSVCQKLRPFWLLKSEEVGNMLAEFITAVGEASNNNYLSEENRYTGEERDYNGEDFAKYVAEFLAYIPPNKRTKIGQKIMKAHAEIIKYFGIFENLENEIKANLSQEEWEKWLS